MITTARPRAQVDRASSREPTSKRDYISFSAISLYQQCPLRYFFKYEMGLPEETVSANLVFGGAIHAAVERHFRELLAGNPPPDLDVLIAEYRNAWQARAAGTILFGKDDVVNTLRILAERMLSAFQQSEFAQPGGKILGVEEELRGRLVAGCPDLLARIDLLVETSESLVVSDLKTARSRWSSEQAKSAGEQLLLYSELVKDLVPGKPLRLQLPSSRRPSRLPWTATRRLGRPGGSSARSKSCGKSGGPSKPATSTLMWRIQLCGVRLISLAGVGVLLRWTPHNGVTSSSDAPQFARPFGLHP